MAIPFISGPRIAAGQSLSDVLDCSLAAPVRISMPPAWTPAHLTFQLSSDGIVFENLLDATGKEIRVNVVPNSVVRLGSQWITAQVYLKFRSGSAGTPIVQAADRIFGCAMDDQSGQQGPQGPQGLPGPQGPAGPSAVSANAGNLARLGTDSLVLVPNTLALKGTVAGDDAAAGNVGEFLAASNPTGIALTSVVTANVTTLNLPAGDWQASGVVVFVPSGTGPNAVIGGINTVSQTMPTDNQLLAGACSLTQVWSASMTSGKEQILPLAMCRINSSVPKVVYLLAQSSFGGGSVTATGRITARRVR